VRTKISEEMEIGEDGREKEGGEAIAIASTHETKQEIVRKSDPLSTAVMNS
jgi:hypothetical protein